jgi:hypothetical protein
MPTTQLTQFDCAFETDYQLPVFQQGNLIQPSQSQYEIDCWGPQPGYSVGAAYDAGWTWIILRIYLWQLWYQRFAKDTRYVIPNPVYGFGKGNITIGANF